VERLVRNQFVADESDEMDSFAENVVLAVSVNPIAAD
jgi:hypothetical protein